MSTACRYAAGGQSLRVRVCRDRKGNTLSVWFADPKKEHVVARSKAVEGCDADLGMAAVGEPCPTEAGPSGRRAPAERDPRRPVELQVQDDCVLLSDFDLWHYVLNYWYLPRTENEGEAFERRLARAGLSPVGCNHGNPPHSARFRREIEKSWERIFDLSWTDAGHRIVFPLKKRSIQGTVWELLLTDVVEIKEFTAR